jgi:hypothetical protein
MVIRKMKYYNEINAIEIRSQVTKIPDIAYIDKLLYTTMIINIMIQNNTG